MATASILTNALIKVSALLNDTRGQRFKGESKNRDSQMAQKLSRDVFRHRLQVWSEARLVVAMPLHAQSS